MDVGVNDHFICLMQSSATHSSLVALDELGRGTATSDGQAIAYVKHKQLSYASVVIFQ